MYSNHKLEIIDSYKACRSLSKNNSAAILQIQHCFCWQMNLDILNGITGWFITECGWFDALWGQLSLLFSLTNGLAVAFFPSTFFSDLMSTLITSGTFCMTWIPRRVSTCGEMSTSAWPPWWRLWERRGMTGCWSFPLGVASTTGKAPASTRSASRGGSSSASPACRPMCLLLSMRNSLLVSFSFYWQLLKLFILK